MNHVTLDKKRPIRFNYYVLSHIEFETGKSYLNFDPDQIQVRDVLHMAYQGCKAADDNFNLSLEEVGEFLSTETMLEVITAFTNDMTGGKDSEKK